MASETFSEKQLLTRTPDQLSGQVPPRNDLWSAEQHQSAAILAAASDSAHRDPHYNLTAPDAGDGLPHRHPGTGRWLPSTANYDNQGAEL
jgi:hypothetical protein